MPWKPYMSLYGPTFYVTPVDLCIIFQCNLNIYHVSCLVEIKLFYCFKLCQLLQFFVPPYFSNKSLLLLLYNSFSCNNSKNHQWYRIGYIVIFNRLSRFPNLALLDCAANNTMQHSILGWWSMPSNMTAC